MLPKIISRSPETLSTGVQKTVDMLLEGKKKPTDR
jgi:hypothetical protein